MPTNCKYGRNNSIRLGLGQRIGLELQPQQRGSLVYGTGSKTPLVIDLISQKEYSCFSKEKKKDDNGLYSFEIMYFLILTAMQNSVLL